MRTFESTFSAVTDSLGGRKGSTVGIESSSPSLTFFVVVVINGVAWWTKYLLHLVYGPMIILLLHKCAAVVLVTLQEGLCDVHSTSESTVAEIYGISALRIHTLIQCTSHDCVQIWSVIVKYENGMLVVWMRTKIFHHVLRLEKLVQIQPHKNRGVGL